MKQQHFTYWVKKEDQFSHDFPTLVADFLSDLLPENIEKTQSLFLHIFFKLVTNFVYVIGHLALLASR